MALLTQSTIDKIKDASITQVIGSFIKLTKKGNSSTGCCPFHNEKTPSFNVNEVKGFYKCFGCGVSGDALEYVMKQKNQTFYEACVTIAEITGITLEYEPQEITPEQKIALSETKQQEKVLLFAIDIYKDLLHKLPENHKARLWLRQRGFTTGMIDKWHIGWGGTDWKDISTPIINAGYYDTAISIGLIKKKEETSNVYDVYRSRIIFPITDKRGRFIGLGGGYIKIDEKDSFQIPKYVNPCASSLYNKSIVLYGLAKAIDGIKEIGYANLVEGYMDVITAHRFGLINTIGSCGTAFTIEQMLLLKNYTKHIVLSGDNDKAGIIATKKHIPELLKLDFKVDVRIYGAKDLDEYFTKGLEAHKYNTNPENTKQQWIDWLKANLKEDYKIECIDHGKISDAIYWLAEEIWPKDEEVHLRAKAKAQILELLSNIKNDFIREGYLEVLTKRYKWKAADTKKQFSEVMANSLTITQVSANSEDIDNESVDSIKFFPWMSDEDKKEFMMNGYTPINRKDSKGRIICGLYTFNQDRRVEITNFVIKPLFRVEAGRDSRYISRIDNGYKNTVIDIPARVYPSVEQFQGECVSFGGSFLIYGSKNQWLRIATDLLHKYPPCIEVNELGWQKRGNFFSYVDCVYLPGKGLEKLDEWGIVKHDDTNYLISAGSEAYRKLQEIGKDPYENLRFLTYKKSPVSFEQWAKMMHRVYGQKGIVGVAYALLTIYKDLVFDVDNNCPHLYAYGEPSSGKSKWAESITAIFYFRRAAFNLNSGTDFAFFSYMSLFANCPSHLNEFDIEVIKLEWFQAIKGAYDGEGRERGKIGVKNATEIQKILSTLILTGQKLVTDDDNSVVSRSLIEGFSTDNNRTEEDKKAYDELKDWERLGMNSMLLEVLVHRDTMVKNYKETLNNLLSKWRKDKPNARDINQRILLNWAQLATGYSMIGKFITFPQPDAEFKEYCYKQAIYWSDFIRKSDTLSEFWRTIEYLANKPEMDKDAIKEGWDYLIQELMQVSIRNNQLDEVKNFPSHTKVLFLRLNNIYPLFQLAFKSKYGKTAMTMENLLHYLKSRPYFLGPVKQKKFKRIVMHSHKVDGVISTKQEQEERVTSCFAFLFEQLELDIGRNMGVEEEKPPEDNSLPFP